MWLLEHKARTIEVRKVTTVVTLQLYAVLNGREADVVAEQSRCKLKLKKL